MSWPLAAYGRGQAARLPGVGAGPRIQNGKARVM